MTKNLLIYLKLPNTNLALCKFLGGNSMQNIAFLIQHSKVEINNCVLLPIK